MNEGSFWDEVGFGQDMMTAGKEPFAYTPNSRPQRKPGEGKVGCPWSELTRLGQAMRGKSVILG